MSAATKRARRWPTVYPIIVAMLMALTCSVLGIVEFIAHPGIPIGVMMAVLLLSLGYMAGWSLKGGDR